MGLRARLRRLQRLSEDEAVTIRQTDGTVRRFPKSALRLAFLEDFDRTLGRIGSETPTHPLLVTIANSDDPTWTRSFVGDGEGRLEPLEDLSEGP